ncbi:MAG: outer membrane lipoprotein carrier protein LolA [Nitrospirae bacterium]|nr:outer membrane lipoprotein carrier protein LolA [Nitrospirota bacterium]
MIKRQSLVVSRQSSVKQSAKIRRLFTVHCSLFTVFFLFTIHYSLFTAFAGDEIERIQEAYKKIEDIKGNFVQKSYIKDLKRTDTYKGSLFIRRPSKMKWEYTGDKHQEVTINNEQIIIYNKTDKQAFRGVFSRDTYGQAPVAMLSGFGNIQEEFHVTSKKNRLNLVPKKPMGNIVSIEIETSESDFPIKSFVINDSHSNRVEVRLKDVKINTGVKDELFDFSLPKGVKVYEHNP